MVQHLNIEYDIDNDNEIKDYSYLLELVCEYLHSRFKHYDFRIISSYRRLVKISMIVDYSSDSDIFKLYDPNFIIYWFDLETQRLFIMCYVRGRCDVSEFDAWLRKRKIENILNI